MPARHQVRRNGKHNGHGFNLATVVQIGLIPIMAAGFTFFSQWVTQGDELKRHESAITETIPKEFKSEADARERNRTEFLDKLDKLNQGVSTLNMNVAVQTQALQALKDQLTQRH